MTDFPAVVCSATKITLFNFPEAVSSVDVSFEGHRVWSIDLRDRRSARPISWPPAVRERLRGRSLVSVSNSATGEVIAKTEASFTQEDTKPNFRNSEGVSLSINKWGRLAPDLLAIGSDIQTLILDRSQIIIGQLQEAGFRPFVVGGTLLGGVRDGKLLPHDDDADIAYLSEHTNPLDVAREAYRVGHLLESLGYKLMRHSATHMQLHFKTDLDHAEYYIDVFTAFFTDDGHINQPFHVRGEMKTSDMLPFSEVTIAGRAFPAPANTNRWLTINYDAEWRTPIPGFAIVTPEPTIRRFNNWFGSFNFGRHFWNSWYTADHSTNIWAAGQDWIRNNESIFAAKSLIDLATGDGTLAAALASDSRTVYATDYAANALDLAAQKAAQNKNIKTAHLNLYRLNTIAFPKEADIVGSFDVVANHVFDQVDSGAHENVLRLMRMALASGGNAVAVFNTKATRGFNPEDPTSWQFDAVDLLPLATKLGLGLTLESVLEAPGKPVVISFSLGAKPFDLKRERNWKKMIKQILKELDPRGTRRQLRALREEIAALKEELDEYRAHSGQFAELLDAAESAFTPQQSDDENKDA